MFFKKKTATTTKQTETPKWVELGMTKEQYDEALSVIYGPKDGDFTSFLNRPTSSSSSTQMKRESNSEAKQNVDPLPHEAHYVSLKTEAQKVTHVSTSQTSPVNTDEGELEKYLKTLDRMVGLQPVKEMIREIVEDVKMRKEREMFGQKMPAPSLNMIFTGNPGTGKTTVAQLVGRIMKAAGVLEKGHFVSVTRADLVVDHIGGTAKKTKAVLQKALGGILFIDEAYSLARGGEQDFGKEAIDMIVEFIESHKGKILVIMAGYTEEMKGLTKANTGIESRFQNIIEFPDYTAEEMVLLARFTARKYQVKWNTETEKVMLEVFNRKQIKGRSDSGNGRLVRNELEAAIRRQSKRLAGKKDKVKEDYHYLLSSDFAIEKGKEFVLEQELAQIVGNEELKKHIRSLAATVKIQKLRKENGLPSAEQSLHMVFKGNPGTGKTTIARILSKLYKELGVVKKGHLVEVTQSDLIGSYVGQTAPKVKEKVKEALGGILFIDEAYTISNNKEFGPEAIGELVKMMEDHRDELIVVLAGYNREMDEFMQTNSGLSSRFPTHFQFEDYNAQELEQLLVQMAKKDSYFISADGMVAVRGLCEMAITKRKAETGNGRFVRNILEEAKRYQANRLSQMDRIPSKEELQELIINDFIEIGARLSKA